MDVDDDNILGIATFDPAPLLPERFRSGCTSVDFPIPMKSYSDVSEFVAHIRKRPHMEMTSEDELAAAVRKFFNENRRKFEQQRDDDIMKEIIDGSITPISNGSLSRKPSKQDQSPAFHDKFAYIMKSSPIRILHAIVRKEMQMRKEMTNLIRARDWEVDHLTRETENVMKNSADTDAHPHELSRLNTKLRQVIGSYNCQVEALNEKQRKDYRDFIESLYMAEQELEKRSDPSSPKSLSVEVDHAAIAGIQLSPVPAVQPKRVDSTPNERRQGIDESFTIYIGAQLKSMHNARILSAQTLTEICAPVQEQEDVSSRLQMSMSLYGKSLSGLILLVSRDPHAHVNGRTAFASICEQSTELHFEPLGAQLEEVSKSARTANTWRADCLEMPGSASGDNGLNASIDRKNTVICRNDQFLAVGDVYCTRHSNIKNVQVVFHLVVDDQLATTDISSRHACLNGLRNIIRLASRLGVTSLYLPLLLIERPTESTTVAWCIRRSEVVLKCVKGYFMEVCGANSGGSVAGDVSLTTPHYNINFVLPAGLTPSTYDQILQMFPTIFHLVPSVSMT